MKQPKKASGVSYGLSLMQIRKSRIRKSRSEIPQQLTQLSHRSHPRHLVGKKTVQEDTNKDITSDSQVNRYADKNEAHPFQSSQYPSKQYSYRQRSPGGRTGSPGTRDSPRYINKSSHIERAKDKYERGNTESPGKKVNHSGSYPGTSNHSNNGHPNNSESRAPAKSSGNPKDPKEVQRSAIRTCGEWSEHISSSGKSYYYNCKTEVSQWEKPRDWIDGSSKPDRQSSDSRNINDRQNSKEIKNRHPSGPEKREKHLGDLRHMVADGNPKPDKKYLFEKLQQSQSQLQAELQANATNKTHTVEHRRTSNALSSSVSSTDYNSSRRSRRDSDGPNGSRTLNRQGTRHDPNEDMDISPGSTPTSLRSSNCAVTPQVPNSTPGSYNLNALTTTGSLPSASDLNISSIPGLINQLSGGKNNQELTNKALQTLQKLQEALSKQIAAHQTSVANQGVSAATVLTSTRQQQQTPQYQQLASIPNPHPEDRVPMHPHPANLSASYPPQRSPYLPSHNSLPPQSSPSTQTYSSVQHQHSSPPIVNLSATATSLSQTQDCSTGFSETKINTVYGKLLGSQSQAVQQQDINVIEDRGGGGRESPMSTHGGSDRSSCCSPAPSETSSQDQEVDPDYFTATTNMKRETSVMAKVAQYYNPNLVGHVTGWQADIAERQAQHFHDDSLRVNGLICGQTSVELKRARSLVRVQEIQATLHEQRNLFLAQQIQELENMKPVSSFLSSS